jgi:hypothetical protein
MSDSPAEEYAHVRRLHNRLAIAISDSQIESRSIMEVLEDLRKFHHPSDLDYMDAARVFVQMQQNLRDLARIAHLWGGQS